MEQEITGISFEQGMKLCEGDASFYRFKLQMFANYISEQAANCREYLKNSDLRSYEVEIHSMKGAALGIGADALSARAKAQEFAAKEGNVEEIQRDAEEILEEFDRMAADLQEFLASGRSIANE